MIYNSVFFIFITNSIIYGFIINRDDEIYMRGAEIGVDNENDLYEILYAIVSH